jgi:hypothetical protein
MILLKLLELLLLGLGILILVTQIIVPAIRGTLLFPFFRREAELEEELSMAKEETVEAGLEKRIKEEKAKSANLRGKK